jgi:hypothetical protein
MVMERGCTDFFFLIAFLATMLGMFGLALFAVAKGRTAMFYAPYDAANQMCGFDAGVEAYSELYFTNLDYVAGSGDFKVMLSSGVCVSSCPNAEQIKDNTWWTENCKKNDKKECPTGDTVGNYAS